MHNVCIIGLGRVGLPLALSLEETGLDVTGVDLNYEMLNTAIKSGKMPFHEPGYEELIKNSKIEVHGPDEYPEAEYYIITVGTPLDKHIEANLTNVENVITTLINQVDLNDKAIILRSTVAPHTTKHVATLLEVAGYDVGENVFLAMCPERIVEGKAYEELKQLPQIIGAEDEESLTRADVLFSRFDVDRFKASYIEAELSKLFTNIYRYINFAIPNYFTYVASQFGVDIFHLFRIMNTGYDRNNGLKLPGFAAGTCVKGSRQLEFYDGENKVVKTYEEVWNTSNGEIGRVENGNMIKELALPYNWYVDGYSFDYTKKTKREINSITNRKYTGKMYKFHLSNGKIFECTADHLIPVKDGGVKRAEEITEKDELYIAH